MNNNQYPFIPNKNSGMFPQQRFNPNFNHIQNQNLSYSMSTQNSINNVGSSINSEGFQQKQIPVLPQSNFNNYQLYPQQNNYNLYLQNPSSIQFLQKNPDNNAYISNIDRLNLYNNLSKEAFLNQQKDGQQLYKKQTLQTSQFTNQPLNNPNFQLQLQQEQLRQNYLQQTQLQQFRLQQFSNPLSQNEQLKQIQQKLQEQQIQKIQQERTNQLEALQQEKQQVKFQQKNQNVFLQQNLPLVFHHQNNNLGNNNISNNLNSNTSNSSNGLSNNSKIIEKKPLDLSSKVKRYPRPIFPLLKPWKITLRNEHFIHTNRFTVIDALYERMSDIHRAILSCYEKGDETKITWPFCIKSIKLNGKILNLERKIPIYGNDGHLLQSNGSDIPFDITDYIERQENIIEIETNTIEKCTDRTFVDAYFHIIFNLMEDENVCKTRIKQDKFTKEETLAIIKKQTVGNSEDDDLIIVDSTVTISLKCPISLIRIVNPVRGIKCQHVQAFELDSYLSINFHHGKWACPICNKKTTTADLKFDQWFYELLNKVPEDIEKVQIDENGVCINKNELKDKENSSQIIYDLDDDNFEIKADNRKYDKDNNNNKNENEKEASPSFNLNNNSININNNNNVINNSQLINNSIQIVNTNDYISTKDKEQQLENTLKRNREQQDQIINSNKDIIYKKKKLNNDKEFQQIEIPKSNTIEEIKDIGQIKFKPIFDRLMNAATTMDFNEIFNK